MQQKKSIEMNLIMSERAPTKSKLILIDNGDFQKKV